MDIDYCVTRRHVKNIFFGLDGFCRRPVGAQETTDLVAVVQARGVKLKKQGKITSACVRSTQEKTPSFHVTPAQNLFHCFGCGAAGSVIDFVMRKDGLTQQQAIDWLVKQSGGSIQRGAVAPRRTCASTAGKSGGAVAARGELLRQDVAQGPGRL